VSHVVLLGDSIFDNATYVPGEPSVIEHLRRCLPDGWQATLLARDGSLTEDVLRQLSLVPDDATHLVVSAGGNDALFHGGPLLSELGGSVAGVLERMADMQDQFRHDYWKLLAQVLRLKIPTSVCTVYDAIPRLSRAEVAGLGLFNDVILRAAFEGGIPVIDLRLVCTKAGDYAASSPIEPSAAGGGKIARAVSRLVLTHDFGRRGTQVFA
jgi:hypothetical protein